MGGGAFAEWQPRYAEVGIATFPVNGKTPAVKGYLGLKLGGSRRLLERFPDADAFGIALRPASISVVDVDTPDERVLADALARHGDTPFIVQSGSGHFQAWYRRHDEGRHVRPDPGTPIDVLGDGFVVVPPSAGKNGPYRVISGSLADLPALPPLRNPPRGQGVRAAAIKEGFRNDTLWSYCMRQALHCDSFEALLDVAETANETYLSPLPSAEVLKTARSAWGYTERGENWFGRGQRVISTHAEVDHLLHRNPDAYILLMILRRHHWGRDFVVANEMTDRMPGGGWTRKRLADARRHLLVAGAIEELRPATKGVGPALFRFRVVNFDHQ